MTLRLVSENPKPVTTNAQIAEIARAFADDVGAGKYGDVSRIALAIEYDGGLETQGWGEEIEPFHMMGLFEAAKMFVFADNIPE